RILCGDPETEVRGVMVGIDVEVGEVLLADRLRDRGRRIDLLLAHHPEGTGMSGFFRVIGMQADMLHRGGVPINVAEALVAERSGEVERRFLPANAERAVDAARLLGIPFACFHTPADNCVNSFLQALIDGRTPSDLAGLVDLLLEIPEYAAAAASPPRVVAGEAGRRPGRIVVEMTGGTEGSLRAPEALVGAGVGTAVVMHVSEKYLKAARKHHLNLVVAGHIASDSLGMNLLLDRLGGEGAFEITPCSGFRRIAR
ncbi:MAG TPA: NGG1p interacting factor NIF3, partial [bacterium]|nr:NGG1p interacting factor NIF3 [bacterium]